jgi:hypothetical protein
MTVVLTATSPKFLVQSSDRLVSRGGRLFDDRANKVIILRTHDATVSIAYSGLAYVRGKPTDHWIAEQLAGRELEPALSMGPPPRALMKLGDTLDRLAREMNQVPLLVRDGTTTIVVGGAREARDRRGVRVARAVHFMGRYRGADGFSFQPLSSRRKSRERTRLSCIGCGRPNRPWDLWSAVHTAPDLRGASDVLASEIRSMSANVPSLIGPDAMSVTMVPRQLDQVTVRYSAADPAGHTYTFAGHDFPASFSPWIVLPAQAHAPQELTGAKWSDYGGLVVTYEDVTGPAVFAGPNGTMRAVFGFGTQPRPREPGRLLPYYDRPPPPPGW